MRLSIWRFINALRRDQMPYETQAAQNRMLKSEVRTNFKFRFGWSNNVRDHRARTMWSPFVKAPCRASCESHGYALIAATGRFVLKIDCNAGEIQNASSAYRPRHSPRIKLVQPKTLATSKTCHQPITSVPTATQVRAPASRSMQLVRNTNSACTKLIEVEPLLLADQECSSDV